MGSPIPKVRANLSGFSACMARFGRLPRLTFLKFARHKAHGHKVVVCLSTTEIKATSTKRSGSGNANGADNNNDRDKVDVEAVEDVKEDMEECSNKAKKAKTEVHAEASSINGAGISRTGTKPLEPSRPVHSAILFLPPE